MQEKSKVKLEYYSKTPNGFEGKRNLEVEISLL